ncbi:MAG: Maf family protein [Ardenticatenia bacterium]|nr:Maf family protein [Ardenticatenia bacterium]
MNAERTYGLVLASQSPRRRHLMALLGLPFDVCPANVPEERRPGEPPAAFPQRLSQEKARAVATHLDSAIVVAADTVVVHRGEILGKPRGPEEAGAMLRRLRGERHRVLTGVTVVNAASGKMITELCDTFVWLRPMSDEEIDAYVASGDPLDKAAAYAIQNAEFAPVEKVVGCPANVMGLPMCHVVRNLRRLGVEVPSEALPAQCEVRYGGYHCALTELVMPGAVRRW